MLNSIPQKRAPMKQLKEAAQVAHKLLVKKKIVHETSVLDQISRDATAPMLPGVPSYLPHRWTIQWAQVSMHAILKKWVSKTANNEKKQENASEFFKFVVLMMQEEERKAKREMKKTERSIQDMKNAKPLSDIFSPMRKYETSKAMRKFFVDSFAVSVIVHANGSTGEYADWFLNDWTPALFKLWCKNNKDAKSSK